MTVAEFLLTPLAVVYGAVARLRAYAYKRGTFRVRRLTGCVIGVGNLTTGGTGKTPVVEKFARAAGHPLARRSGGAGRRVLSSGEQRTAGVVL